MVDSAITRIIDFKIMRRELHVEIYTAKNIRHDTNVAPYFCCGILPGKINARGFPQWRD
jgi:hypothetical protein